MEVDRPGAEVVAAGHRQPNLTATRQQRAEDVDRSADPFDLLVRRDRDEVAGVRHPQASGCRNLRRDADRRQEVAHDRHVGDLRHVGQLVGAVGEDRRDHQLEHRVLRARDVDGALQLADVADGDLPRSRRHHRGERASASERAASAASVAGERNGVMTDQYAPAVPAGGEHRQPTGTRRIVKEWPDDPVVARRLQRPRDDLLLEVRRTGGDAPETTFDQADGPFTAYRRDLTRVSANGDSTVARDDALSALDPVVRVVVRAAGARRAGPARRRTDPRRSRTRRRRADAVVGAAGPARPARHHGARAAGGGVDVVGVRQHALHADGQLRRRRLRRRRHGHRRRRRDRPRSGSCSCCRWR